MGEWYCTAENATLPQIVEHLNELKVRVSAHDIVTFNQDHPTAGMVKPQATPYTDKGKPRTYMSKQRFKADTYLKLCAEPETQPEDYEDGKLVRNSRQAVMPRVEERRADIAPCLKQLKT
eukprot:COSAG02_NODE_387_length_23294_cov_52.630610_8_plen_120_part_00